MLAVDSRVLHAVPENGKRDFLISLPQRRSYERTRPVTPKVLVPSASFAPQLEYADIRA